jgi:hypothetical protein
MVAEYSRSDLDLHRAIASALTLVDDEIAPRVTG